MDAAFKYRAFISYSHRDRAWGDWVHKALETYRVPKRLIGTEGRDGPVPAKLFPIFRDREELPSSSDLNEQIKAALEQSAYLIVICSPAGAQSRWVNEEILAFKRLGRENRILALVVDGEPNAEDKPGTDPARECFPTALRFKLGADGGLTSERVEPVAADARPQGDGRENARLKLIAGLIGVGYDALKQRDLEAARRRARLYQAIAASMTLLAVLAAGAAWFAFAQRQEARYQRDQVVQAQMRLLTQAAAQRLKDGDVPDAQGIILEVLAHARVSPIDRAAAISVFQEARAADSQLAALSGHSSFVNSAFYSPDGKRIVSASDDKTARIWDAATGAQTALLTEQNAGFNFAIYSPDGRHIVTASSDKTARIWDAQTGAQLALLSGHGDAVVSASYSPDGSRIVTASYDKTARVWGAATGAQRAVLSGHGDAVNFSAWSPDGTRIVTASDDRTARIWDAATGKQRAVLSGHGDTVFYATYSPDGRFIVTASADKTARVWDAATAAQLRVLSGHGARVVSAVFSPDGKRIVTASIDKTARIWDAATGAQLAVLFANVAVLAAAYAPDGRHIVTTSFDNTVRIWDAAAGAQLAVLPGLDIAAGYAAWSPDGRRIVTAWHDKKARVWDAATGTLLAVMSGHGDIVNSAVFSADGRRIVTASSDGTARIWNAVTGLQMAALPGQAAGLTSAAWSPDDRRIVTASQDKSARIFGAATSTQLAALWGHSDYVMSAAWSPDGKRVVTASIDKTARIWDAATGAQLRVLSGHSGDLFRAVYSPDGKRIVTASADGTARIWDAATGAQFAVLSGHNDIVFSAAFSPDGRRIVTASGDKTARIWDAATGEQLADLSGHSDRLADAAYSPDGMRIVTTSGDRTVRIWDARIPADLDGQIDWSAAAEFDVLSDVERSQLGLLPNPRVRTWQNHASKCDQAAAAPYDPDRQAPGVSRDRIVGDVAASACAPAGPTSIQTSRMAYEFGRALLAKRNFAGARREVERAVSEGYRAARIDLANLLVEPAAGMPDPDRAILLLNQAWQDGVPIAAFELGHLYEFGVQRKVAASRDTLRPDLAEAWFWYRKGANVGEPNALARYGEKNDANASGAVDATRKNAILLAAFRFYAAAAERAQDEDWPDDAWRTWRYRRATIARLLAREDMMQQVADAYVAVRDKWRPHPPTIGDRVGSWLGL